MSNVTVIAPGTRVMFVDVQIEHPLYGTVQGVELYDRQEVRYSVIVWSAKGDRQIVAM